MGRSRIIESFQKNEGATYKEHLRKGIEELEKDLGSSILVLSGFV